MRIEAVVRHVPAYFNRVAFCNIPERWTAEVVSDLPRGLMVYSDGCSTREEAISDLIGQLKRFGLKGTLRLV